MFHIDISIQRLSNANSSKSFFRYQQNLPEYFASSCKKSTLNPHLPKYDLGKELISVFKLDDLEYYVYKLERNL